MKYTNRGNLPDAIVKAVTNDPYSKGDADYSVTQLLKPARIVALEKIHAEELTEDVSDRIWSLFGQAVHVIAERANENGIAERRLVANFNGIRISGGMDLYHSDGVLVDYKTTSVWKVKNSDYEEWTQQLNCYAEILRQNGFPVTKLKIIAFLRDWSKPESRKSETYPQSQAKEIDIELWSQERALGFVKTRIDLHEAAKKALPECTPEERWAKPSIWAIKKKGAARAIPGGLFADKSFAERKLVELGSGYEIEYRAGDDARCANYCLASTHCSQFNKKG